MDHSPEPLESRPVPINRKRRRAPESASDPVAHPSAPGSEGGAVETREERIARIRKLIQDGNYNPDPYEVARAMMERGGLT